MDLVANRPLVVIESPFAGDVHTNVFYADCLLYDSLMRDESPFLGHLLYTRVFNDEDPKLREAGIQAHIAVIARASYVVLGLDLGKPTKGMLAAIEAASNKVPVVERYLGPGWEQRAALQPTPLFGVYPYKEAW